MYFPTQVIMNIRCIPKEINVNLRCNISTQNNKNIRCKLLLNNIRCIIPKQDNWDLKCIIP